MCETPIVPKAQNEQTATIPRDNYKGIIYI